MFRKTCNVFLETTKRWMSTTKKYKKHLQVLRQDIDKFPTLAFPKPKRTDRRVYVWGYAGYGALGNEKFVKKAKKAYTRIIHHPTRQSFAERKYVLDVASGYGFSLYACKAEDDGYTLFGSGLNTDSQIGFHKLGGVTNKPMMALIYPAAIALPKASDEVVQIKSVSAGRAHSVALSDAGIIYTLGNNAYGQCARPIVEDERYGESLMIHRIDGNQIEQDNEVENTVCGQDHTLLVMKNGNVYSCGWGADGQTGLGHYNTVDTLTRVEGDILNERIVKVSSIADFVLALNDKGEVFGWGNSEYSQLELPEGQQQLHTPMHIKSLKKCGKIVDIAAGGSSCLVLNEDGEVFVWGYGILGIGPSVDHAKEPTIIPPVLFGRNEFNPESRITSVYSGLNHMGALTNAHDLYMWGKNRGSCLGLGKKKDQFFPFKVAIGAHCLKVACGIDHTLAYCKPFVSNVQKSL